MRHEKAARRTLPNSMWRLVKIICRDYVTSSMKLISPNCRRDLSKTREGPHGLQTYDKWRYLTLRNRSYGNNQLKSSLRHMTYLF